MSLLEWQLVSETYNLNTSFTPISTPLALAIFKPSYMKFHPDPISVQSIKSYGPGWIQVANERYNSSVVIASSGALFLWHCKRFEDLTSEHFEQLVKLQPELVIFGSGARLRFPAVALTSALIERQIGVETMDTQAACRTYNVLAGEGRSVVVALLLES
jgi:uncharacterized protein